MFKKMRRRILGMIIGGLVGGSFSLYSTKSHALLGGLMSPEKLFELFLKKAGPILMRFLGYRFMANLEKGIDNYSKKNKEINENKNSDIAMTYAQNSDMYIKFTRERANFDLDLNSAVSPIACLGEFVSETNNQTYHAMQAAIPIAADKIKLFSEVKKNQQGEQIHYRNQSLMKLLDDHGSLHLQELTKIVGVHHFKNSQRAEEELAALLGNNMTNDIEQQKDFSRVPLQGRQAQANTITDALMSIFLQRVKSIKIESDFKDSLSDNLKSLYRHNELSLIEHLHLEVLSVSSNAKFTDIVMDTPSLTTGVTHLNYLSALKDRIALERYKLAQKRNLVHGTRNMLKGS